MYVAILAPIAPIAVHVSRLVLFPVTSMWYLAILKISSGRPCRPSPMRRRKLLPESASLVRSRGGLSPSPAKVF